jgi:hypothetical protein
MARDPFDHATGKLAAGLIILAIAAVIWGAMRLIEWVFR